MQITNTFRAKIVDVSPRSIIVEVTGNKGKTDAILELFKPFGVLEVVRTGTVAISRKAPLKAPVANELKTISTEAAKEMALPKKSP